MNSDTEKEIIFPNEQISRLFIIFSLGVTLFYSLWWLDFSNMESRILYGLLFIGEAYHIWQVIGYIYTVRDQKKYTCRVVPPYFSPAVDVFITVCGEPTKVVEETLAGAMAIDYPNYRIYILNDGYVAKKENWREIEDLAKKYGANVITRTIPGGAKAGNINNGLKQTNAPFFALFDADHAPKKDFLKKTLAYFQDSKMALVQTPQYYKNKDQNHLTRSAWEQQELFFGPICQGKNKDNATFWCGTNAVIRRSALEEIGGILENTVTEDFLVSLYLHQKGYKSIYIPEILSEGLAPQDLKSYVSQQYRWARGCLDLIFNHNPIFKKGLTKAQKIHYLYSSSYYLNGLIVAINALIPIFVLMSGISPVKENVNNFMIYFFPFIFTTIYLLMKSTKFKITFNAIQISMSSFFVFIAAAISALFNVKTKFKVTSKTEQSGNYLVYALPHITYILLTIFAITFAVTKHGFTPSVVTNTSWALFNIVFFLGFIRVAYPWETVTAHLKSKVSSFYIQTANFTRKRESILHQVNLSPEKENQK
ncbi:MAG: cellulose synthase (UDP-forming) [Parcubacteria group bacterium Gr01-1014_2]|nr:MAG: cellulose synthase (UDP-forming) [Parcubacteria group bacterium Gr01-1014_2]